MTCKHDWVGDDNCAYCRAEDAEAALQEIIAVTSGERQVADDDTGGMEWVDKRARAALGERK